MLDYTGDMMYQGLSNAEQLDAIDANLASATGPVALGACIFAGGFSLGLEEAGFDVAGHLELPDLTLGTETSRQRWPVLNAPLSSQFYDGSKHSMELTWLTALASLPRKPDFFYANPPCVAYAGTGKHHGTLDERMCYLRYCSYEAAMRLEPTVWAWELVPGVFSDERAFLEAMAYRASRKGYECHAFLTSAANHGGYQDRRRFHFIASRVAIDFESSYRNAPPNERGVRTLGECLDDVAKARISQALVNVYPGTWNKWGPLDQLSNDSILYKGAFCDLMPHCPPGSHLRDVGEEVMRKHYKPGGKEWSGKGVPGFAHTRARLDRPSPNVLGGHTIIHPVEDRYLTPRECAAIMGFPMDYRFSKGAKAYAEIGRGLCTHNARFVGRSVMDALLADKPADVSIRDGQWLRVVDWRRRAKRINVKMSPIEQAVWKAGQQRQLQEA